MIPLLTLVLALPAAPQENWPSFRGPDARGLAPGAPMATEWNVPEGTGVLWRTPVPGLAHSSPVIWGRRMFVTTAVRTAGESELSSLYGSPGYGAGESVEDEGEHRFAMLCLDTASGEVLWERTLHTGKPRTMRHPKSSHASATPACDAERVVASFGSEGLFALDHDGEVLWQADLGTLDVGAPGHGKEGYQWGFASSPVVYGDRVLVQVDHEGPSYLAAFDATDGKELWRRPREENSTWCTPTVHPRAAGGRSQVIVNGYQHIGGYDLATGEEIWKLVGGGDVPVPTPVVVDDLIYLTSSHGPSRPLRAVHVEAQGTLGSDPQTEEHLAWSHPRRGVYMQTPLVIDGLVYACSDGGILGCYDARTGEEVYRERVGSGGTGFSGSPVAADGKLYLSGESGEVHVVQLGREFKLLAVNDLGETCMATPAAAGPVLFFRTRHHVVAIGQAPAAETETEEAGED